MQNKSTNQLIGLGILTLFVLAILYEIWPYLVGFLAVVGGAQVYRVWRNHYGRLLLTQGNYMKNWIFIVGLFALGAMKAVWIWTIWLMVVGALALSGIMRVVLLWRYRPPRSRL